MRQKFRVLVNQAQGYEIPPIARLLIRIKNGVPAAKAEALFRQEMAIARARQQQVGEGLS